MRMFYVFVLFCFLCKENKFKVNIVCVSIFFELWKLVIFLDRKDFRLNLVFIFRGSWLLRVWERVEFIVERGVGGFREDSLILGIFLFFFKVDVFFDFVLFLFGLKLRF